LREDWADPVWGQCAHRPAEDVRRGKIMNKKSTKTTTLLYSFCDGNMFIRLKYCNKWYWYLVLYCTCTGKEGKKEERLPAAREEWE
jgi:hypothetical protein